MSDQPLPCPFCAEMPMARGYNCQTVFGCETSTCPAYGPAHPLAAWNTRAPVAKPAVCDVALARFTEAYQAIRLALRLVSDRQEGGLDVLWGRLSFAERKMYQAFDALDTRRPPAAPVSVAFWLGREA